MVGFHAQQAVETSVKAALVAFGAEIPFTHDLSFLVEVALERDPRVPDAVSRQSGSLRGQLLSGTGPPTLRSIEGRRWPWRAKR